MKKVEYILRHRDTKEPIIVLKNRRKAINMAGQLNKAVNMDKVEVLKRITTIETSVL